MPSGSLEDARREALSCRRCLLWEGRRLVYGSGCEDADLMVVGEAPGRTEDEAGIPFVGDAGQLLDDMLREIGLKRDDVYVANVVKHRPIAADRPRNRAPRAPEIAACVPWLHEQIRLVDPKLIVPLGNVPLRRFRAPKAKITQERGELFRWEGRSVIATYHPAYVMRFPKLLADYRIDFVTIQSHLAALSAGGDHR